MKQSTRFILDMFKGKKKELTVIIAIATFGAILATAIPYLYGRLFDLAIDMKTPFNILLSLIGLWLVLSLISNFTSNRTGLLGEVLGTSMSLEAEADAYSHFLTLPILFHKKKQRGEVLHKISRGAWTLQGLIERVADILPQFLMLIFSLIAMLIIEWKLAVILIISFVIYGFLTIKMTKPVMEARRKEYKVFDKQYGNVYDKLYNVFLVKNFAMEDLEKKNFFKALVGRTIPAVKRASKKANWLSNVQGIVYSVSFVSVLGTAIFLLRQGQITPGEFVMFFGYINLAFGPIRYLSGIYRQFKQSAVAIKRFLRLRRLVPERMKHGNKTLKEVKGEINFKDITFEYVKGKEILKGINLIIKPGQSIALVGKSGVGKTTLSELILGYYKQKKGKILLDGVDIAKLSLKWIRNQIAIVPQDLNLFNDTLLNNLRYANEKATEKQVVAAAKAASAHDFISKLPKGYKSMIGEEGVKLSMGQRQRIAITMAFLKNPKILILDEPTAALDAESEKRVQEGIKRLIKGKTTVIIAHRFSTVRNVDKIVVLDKGNIIEYGDHQELMKKKGLYHRLYTLQKGFD